MKRKNGKGLNGSALINVVVKDSQVVAFGFADDWVMVFAMLMGTVKKVTAEELKMLMDESPCQSYVHYESYFEGNLAVQSIESLIDNFALYL